MPAAITSPEALLFANKPSEKGSWGPSGSVRRRRLGTNIYMTPNQYADNAGGGIDPSLSTQTPSELPHSAMNPIMG